MDKRSNSGFDDLILKEYVKRFMREDFVMNSEDRLLLYADCGSDPALIDVFQAVAAETGIEVKRYYIAAGSSLADANEFLVSKIRDFRPTRICELSEQYFYHTDVWRTGVELGARVYSLCGLDCGGFVRCVGEVDRDRLIAFGVRLEELLSATDRITIHSKGGRVLNMRMGRGFLGRVFRKLTGEKGRQLSRPAGVITKANPTTFLGGQISFLGLVGSIHGEFLVDGYVWPPSELRALDEAAVLKFSRGRLVGIDGDNRTASLLKDWFVAGGDYLMSHVCLGFNSGAGFTSSILEAERVMGGVNLGIGVGERHCDLVSSSASLEFDGLPFAKDGRYIEPSLRAILDSSGRPRSIPRLV